MFVLLSDIKYSVKDIRYSVKGIKFCVSDIKYCNSDITRVLHWTREILVYVAIPWLCSIGTPAFKNIFWMNRICCDHIDMSCSSQWSFSFVPLDLDWPDARFSIIFLIEWLKIVFYKLTTSNSADLSVRQCLTSSQSWKNIIASAILSPSLLLLMLLALLHVQHWPVFVYHVPLEVTGCHACKITLTTFVWLFSSVLAHMGQFLQGGKNGHLMSFFF